MEKILVINNNSSNPDYYANILSSAGFDILTASNRKEAIEKYGAEKPDLVLVNDQPAALSGIETARMIRQKYGTREVPIFLTSSGGISKAGRLKAKELGINDVIIEPINSAQLLSKIITSLKTKNADKETVKVPDPSPNIG